jgi:hypothetical protein
MRSWEITVGTTRKPSELPRRAPLTELPHLEVHNHGFEMARERNDFGVTLYCSKMSRDFSGNCVRSRKQHAMWRSGIGLIAVHSSSVSA